MWKSITGRITLIVVLTAAAVIVLVPSLTDRVPAGWKDRVPKINLGLDLQGGVFLRLAVEIDKAIENTSMRYAALRCMSTRYSRAISGKTSRSM